MSYGYSPASAMKALQQAGQPVAAKPQSNEPRWDQQSARPQADTRSAPAILVTKAVERLMELIESETSALRSGALELVPELSARKNHALLELNRMVSTPVNVDGDSILRGKLKKLREVLDVNRLLIQKHLAAVQEVADMIADNIRDSESDGTYGRAATYSR